MKNTLKSAGLGLLGLLAAAPNQDVNAQDSTISNQEANAQDSVIVQQADIPKFQILESQGASKEVIVDENYKVPFTQGADTLKLASINPENDAYVTLKDSQKFFEFTNEMGERERESLEHILTNGGSLHLPFDTKLEGKKGDLYLISGENKEPGVDSYAIGRSLEKSDEEATRHVIAHLGDMSKADFLKEHKSDLREEVNSLYKKVDDKQQRIAQQDREIETIKEQLGKRTYGVNVNATAQTGSLPNMFGGELGVTLGNYHISGGVAGTPTTQNTTSVTEDTKHHPRLPLEGVSRETNTLVEKARAFTLGIERNLGTPIISLGLEAGHFTHDIQGRSINETYFLHNGERIDHQKTTHRNDNSDMGMMYGPSTTVRIGPLNVNGAVLTDGKNFNYKAGVGVNFGGNRK